MCFISKNSDFILKSSMRHSQIFIKFTYVSNEISDWAAAFIFSLELLMIFNADLKPQDRWMYSTKKHVHIEFETCTVVNQRKCEPWSNSTLACNVENPFTRLKTLSFCSKQNVNILNDSTNQILSLSVCSNIICNFAYHFFNQA